LTHAIVHLHGNIAVLAAVPQLGAAAISASAI
jgi:hypothetical protein